MNSAHTRFSEEFLLLAGAHAVSRALLEIKATHPEILMVAELIPAVILTARARSAEGLEHGAKVAVMTPAECRRLIDALDALYRETGTESGDLRSQLVNAAYGVLRDG